MGAKFWNGSGYSDFAAGDILHGASKANIGSVRIWDGSAYQTIWPTFTPYSFSDTFATDATLDSYADWVAPTVSGVTLTVTSGAVTTTTSTTAGSRRCYGHHVNQLKTDLGIVRSKIAVRAPTAYDATLFMCGNTDYSDWVGIYISTDTATQGINTSVGGTITRRTAFAPPAQNSVVSLEATTVNGHTRYTARNVTAGTTLGYWDDTADVVVHGDGHRYCGVRVLFSRSGFSNYFSSGWDDFYMSDPQ